MKTDPTTRPKAIKIFYARLFGSVLAFAAFLALNVTATLIGEREWGLASIIPLALSYFSLPRRIPTDQTGAQADSDPDLAMRLSRAMHFIGYLRAAYIILALFVLLALPRIIPPPV